MHGAELGGIQEKACRIEEGAVQGVAGHSVTASPGRIPEVGVSLHAAGVLLSQQASS